MTKLLHEPVARHAAERPHAIAVTLGDEAMTYAELDALSNRIGHTLLALGLAPGDRACLFLPKGPRTVAAMLGCLKAGSIYVPLDLGSPPARLAKIVSTAAPAAVLTEQASASTVAALARMGMFGPSISVVVLDGTSEDAGIPVAAGISEIAAQPENPPEVPRRSSDAAHILFTSGSTGDPKGVVITHGNVATFLDWAIPYFAIEVDDRLSGHAPFHFDLSTFDVFGALRVGAELHLVPPQLNLLPRDLARFIAAKELTQWFSVPSVLAYMSKLQALPEMGFSSLRRIIWCGDVLPTPVLAQWMRRHPRAAFTNLYGPTEATIASSYHTVAEPPDDETAPIPIGRPCAGEELLVLDGEFQAVPAGESGDLYIAGAGLSPGYWADPERTAAAFIPDPTSVDRQIYKTGDLARIDQEGIAYFLGRADTQIKSRGHRIELGEIEAAIHTLAHVREVAIVALATNDFEGKAICCAWVSSSDAMEPADDLQRELRKLLPAYMLPSRWLRLPELPKNANGKIDRNRIREHFSVEADAAAAGVA